VAEEDFQGLKALHGKALKALIEQSPLDLIGKERPWKDKKKDAQEQKLKALLKEIKKKDKALKELAKENDTGSSTGNAPSGHERGSSTPAASEAAIAIEEPAKEADGAPASGTSSIDARRGSRGPKPKTKVGADLIKGSAPPGPKKQSDFIGKDEGGGAQSARDTRGAKEEKKGGDDAGKDLKAKAPVAKEKEKDAKDAGKELKPKDSKLDVTKEKEKEKEKEKTIGRSRDSDHRSGGTKTPTGKSVTPAAAATGQLKPPGKESPEKDKDKPPSPEKPESPDDSTDSADEKPTKKSGKPSEASSEDE